MYPYMMNRDMLYKASIRLCTAFCGYSGISDRVRLENGLKSLVRGRTLFAMVHITFQISDKSDKISCLTPAIEASSFLVSTLSDI